MISGLIKVLTAGGLIALVWVFLPASFFTLSAIVLLVLLVALLWTAGRAATKRHAGHKKDMV